MFTFPLTNCNECTLSGNFGQGYEGDLDKADVIFFGEAPGEREEETGLPFQGRAGQLLREILNAIDFPMERVVISNINLCRPPNNRKPTTKEIKYCSVNREALIDYVKPSYIILLGATPLAALLKKKGISKYRGQVIKKEGITYLPVYHPSYILRQQTEEMINLYRTDWENIKRIITGKELKKFHKDYYLISNLSQFNEMIKIIKEEKKIAVDIETTGLYFWKNKIRSIQFSTGANTGFFLPILEHKETIEEWNQENLIWEPITDITEENKVRELPLFNYWGEDELKYIKEKLSNEIFLNDSILITGQNFKFDQKFLEYWLFYHDFNKFIKNTVFDTMFASYLIDENTPNDLKTNSYLYFENMRGYAQELRSKLGKVEDGEEDFTTIPLNTLLPYAVGDVDATFQLTELYVRKLNSKQKWWMYNFYMPLHQIYAEGERKGVGIDIEQIKKVKEEYTERSIKIEDEICKIAGKTPNSEIAKQIREENPGASESKLQRLIKSKIFNLNSSKQVAEVLFEQMKIPILKKTPTGAPSVNSEVLRELSLKYPFCRKIVDFKNMSKMISTYLNGALKYTEYEGTIVEGFPMVHYNINLIGTVTGRFSSKKLAVQTIPRKPEIRKMICAPPGWKLIEFDLSQIELRLAAWYSQDPTMLEEYRNGVDIHLETMIFMISQSNKCSYEEAREIALKWKREKPKFFKERRKRAKLFNFGGLYQGSAENLAAHINEKLDENEEKTTPEEAQAHLDYFFNKYKGLSKYYELIKQKALETKQVVSCFGRVRHLPELNLPNTRENSKIIQEALRQALNSPIQATASDITEFAAIEIDQWLKKNKMKAYIAFSVHDALLSLVPDEEVHDYCIFTKKTMEKERPPIMKNQLEIKVEGTVGNYWGDTFDDEKLAKFNLTKKMLED